MVCFDLEQCLSISLLTEQVFEKASFGLSPECDFSGMKEDSPGSPPPLAHVGLGYSWGRAVLCLVQSLWGGTRLCGHPPRLPGMETQVTAALTLLEAGPCCCCDSVEHFGRRELGGPWLGHVHPPAYE